jgi:alkyl hydroperoxide reductase subunit AhpF
MNRLLDENITAQIRDVLAGLDQPVHLMFFGRDHGCEYCNETRQLVEEVVALSNKLSLDTYDLDINPEVGMQYQMDKAPGILFATKNGDRINDLGIRYAGIPSGHEFSSFIQDILLASSRDSGLAAETRAFLQSLKEPVRLQVFVTPT